MRVRLLGPVHIAVGGELIPVAGLRRRALLVALALQAGEVVPSDRLIELVWAGDAASANTLQRHVSFLRDALGDRRAIVARRPGYTLELPGDATDVMAAERLIVAGRRATDPARAATLLREALALWRGEPLADVTDVPWIARQADRLAALHAEAERLLTDARLAVGEHAALLPELREAAAGQPFDEQVQAQLVRALYRCGRQAEALATLRDIRGRLADELGVDPGPALRELESAVLRQDVALDPPGRPAPATSPPSRVPLAAGPFVGRADELSSLAAGTSTVAVAGDPGIGKTRLLAEYARAVDARGGLVLWGRAADVAHQPPFGLVADALADAAPTAADRLSDEDRALLAGVMLPTAGSAPALGGERYRLHRAVRALLAALAPPAGLLLVLDDVHAADDGSAELIEYLLRRPPSGPVQLALAYRPRQLTAAVRAAVGRAVQEGTARLVEPRALTWDEARELVAADLSAAAYEASGGNPLHLLAVTAGASASSVRSALAAEVAALPASVARLAWAVAVAGALVPPEVFAATAELAVPDVIAARDELVRRDVLRPAGARMEFRHPLLRDAAYEAAGEAWCRAAHARAAHALAASGAPAAERAHHVERSASPGDAQAVTVLREAAVSVAHTSPATAVRWLAAALDLWPADDSGTRLGLLGMRAQALAVMGRLAESRDALHDIVRLLPADAIELRAQLVATCAGIARLLGRSAEAVAMLQAELSGLPDRAGAAALTLMIGLAGTHTTGRDRSGEDWPSLALSAARRHGQRQPLVAALTAYVIADQLTGEVDSLTTGCLDEASVLFDAMPDGELAQLLHTGVWLAMAELCHERPRDAVRHADRTLAVSRATGQSYVIALLHTLRGAALRMSGAVLEAARCLDNAYDATVLAGMPEHLVVVLAQQSVDATFRGDLERGRQLAREAVTLAAGRTHFTARTATSALATAHLFAGDPAACADLLVGVVADTDRAIDPLTRITWFSQLAQAEVALGRHDAAMSWAESAERELKVWATPRRAAAARLGKGHALRVVAPAEAARHALWAAETFAGVGDPIRAAHARLLAGTALAASGATEAARVELRRARALFDACGIQLLQAEAARRERALDGPAPTTRKRLAARQPARRNSAWAR